MKTITPDDPQPHSNACAHSGCGLHRNCFLGGLSQDEAADCAAVIQRRYRLHEGDSLFRHNQPFSALYFISEGVVKTERVTPEGTQLVTGFHFAGDIVGLEAISDSLYPCDAITVTETRVCKLNFDQLLLRCSHHPDMLSWIISEIGQHTRRKEMDQCWSQGMNGRHRTLRFFVNLYQRLSFSGTAQHGSPVALPMKKQDIARYLHITPETLSRTLADLRKQELLYIDQCQFRLPDPARALELTQL